MIDYAQARRMMVDCQLRTFDVNDNTVLDAFDTVPREAFVPKGREPFAYIDQTLNLGEAGGETRCMPAPMVVARMIQALRVRPGVAALDVATGYGYAAAVMAELGAQVTALESVPDLAAAARTRLGASAQVIEGPIADGAPKQGPFDVILINGRVEVRPQALLNQLKEVAPKITPFIRVVWKELNERRRRGDRILFEGAQGVMLDIDHGTSPYVTSSNTVAGQIAAGAGIGPRAVGYVLGITKAYTTRVGSGPFPSELTDEIGELIGARGKEFGVVTGRKRRCGWFDAALVRQSAKVSGIDGIAFTKLDILDGFEELKICTGYTIDGEEIDHLPAATQLQAKAKPVYESIEGWQESTKGARSWAQLPAQAIKYIRRVEELIEVPVALLSTSPERDDTILVTDPFAD